MVKALPEAERRKVRDWIDEHRDIPADSSGDEKFRLALKWIDAHRKEFDGQFVLLDGDRLLSHGNDAKKLYDFARAQGITSPFIKRIKAEILPFGGW